ncbi:MAG TPA: helix-turn-helix domain-containing protein [Chloroflexota bacterium]|nr:helix-turn-helix domain-containing protein [Chloroflexota bacterium]
MGLFELAIPCEVFGQQRENFVEPWYEFRVCAAEPGLTRVGANFVAGTVHSFEDLDWADTVIVPAYPFPTIFDQPRAVLVEAVRTAHQRGARVASLCTGAFVLAAAGLLDGRRATTHWMYAGLLAQRYPRVKVDPAVLYVDEGDVLTSAGLAAGLDLCLHLVRLDHGPEVANLLARRLVIPPHRPGGQAQYVEMPLPRHEDDSLAPLLHWALEHLDQPLTIQQLAARQSVTPRTLIRRFRAATGLAPLQRLLAQRVQRARELLESADDPPARIAESCGLGTEANLRHHFARLVGLSPTEYRREFRRSAACA